ncbi:NUC188 domain-domain-containing protein [Absidia repens]|uniref:NUC188 domain-domain-containing protein n=1 Tax=Absidia repens TaxID=90262 RepID=A0A1X2ITE8_9FUNG|nr:NUC188 domain-domain-containing protein [Absidia repens]
MSKKNKGSRLVSTSNSPHESFNELPHASGLPSNKKKIDPLTSTPTPSQLNEDDSFLKSLPKVGGIINADQFFAARMQEVNSMQSSIKQTSAVLKIPSFDSLPRFLRRRAAGHDMYHLRARDRAKLSAKIARGQVIRPSLRKIKSKMIMDELISRKNNVRWLSTHKWHIKRMKMENWWGYRLAAHPMYKSRKVNYRSFTKISLLHDASYQGCLQVHGSQKLVTELLNKFTDPLLPSVGSNRFIKGTRIGHSYFYSQGGYPTNLISPITFLWRSSTTDNDATLWLWTHPSAFEIIQQQIQDTASLMQTPQVKVQNMQKDFARFELTGPRSKDLLQSILVPVDEHGNSQPNSVNAQLWTSLQHIRSGCALPNGAVIGLTVQDPRLRFPQKARPANVSGDVDVYMQATQDLLSLSMDWPIEASRSGIWDESIRRNCEITKLAESHIIKRREKMPLPGSKLPFTAEDSKIPLLLIQRSGPLFDQSPLAQPSEFRTENIDGWTLIVPRTFGNSFWRSLVYAGARTGGLDDVHNMYFDCGYSCFPYDYPTTRAFEEYQEITGSALKQKWERQPPSKRINFSKLGIDSPHHIPFHSLLSSSSPPLGTLSTMDYSYDNESYRKSAILLQNDKLVSVILNSKSDDKKTIEAKLMKMMANGASARGMMTSIAKAPSLESMAVRFRLKSIHAGTFSSNARVYLMKDASLYQNYSTVSHDNIKISQLENFKAPSPQDLIGYVTSGHYSLMTGQGQGIGACSASGLYQIQQIDTCQNRTIKRLVLVRNVSSQDYHLAILSVV